MKYNVFLVLFPFCTTVAAHGQVTGIVAGGVYYQGYLPQFQFQYPPPKLAGWSIPQDSKNGPVYPASYNSPDIICHIGATPGATSVPVTAGSTVELQWTPWPVTHHGPVIDYLANCNGPCENVDKTKLESKKIDATGLLRESTAAGRAGYWAADKLRDSNNSWTVTIPSSIAPGNYVLRHEIIALHSARVLNGAQNYPHCVNLEVSGAGTDSLAQGTLGTELYKANDPGIEIDIYKPLDYIMPGPTLDNHSDSPLQLPHGNSTTASWPLQVAPKAQESPEHNAAPQEEGVTQLTAIIDKNTTDSASLLTTSAPLAPISSNDPNSSNLPKSTKIHPLSSSTSTQTRESQDSSYNPSTSPILSPPLPSSPPTTSTPAPATTRLNTAIATPSPTPSPTSTINRKPCTRRIRITTSPSSTPILPTTSQPSFPPPAQASSSPLPAQSQSKTLPSGSPTPEKARLEETPPSAVVLEDLSVQQLMRWLRAIVAALSRKINEEKVVKRGHARDMNDL